MEENIHISFKEKKQDLNQNISGLEESLENLSLNNNSQNQNSLHIATKDSDEEMVNNPESSLPYQVYDDTLESSKATIMRRGYTGARDLRVVSQNQVIGNYLKQ